MAMYTLGKASIYIATLGNDSAPAAIGLKALKLKGIKVDQAIFIPDSVDSKKPEDHKSQHEALLQWVECMFPDAQARIEHTHKTPHEFAQLVPSGANVYANYTGGSKPLSIAWAIQAQQYGATVFTIDSHGPKTQYLHYLSGEQSEVLDERALLDLKDYQQLYISPFLRANSGQANQQASNQSIQIQALLKEAPSLGQYINPHTVLCLEGNYYLAFVHNGNLHLVSLSWGQAAYNGSSTKLLAQFKRYSQQLGGQMAVALARAYPRRPSIDETAHANEEQNYQTRLRNVGLKPQSQFLNEQKPSSSSPKATSLTEIEPPKGSALVCLVGAQPMPSIVAFFEHQPQSVYLLSSPGVKRTTERIAEYLRSREVHAQCVWLDNTTPATTGHAVKKIFDLAQESRLPFHLCANGLTKAMAAFGVLALPEQNRSLAQYVYRNQIKPLLPSSSPDKEVDLANLDISDYARLHEVSIVDHTRVWPNQELMKTARKFLETAKSKERGHEWYMHPEGKRFIGLWEQLFNGKPNHQPDPKTWGGKSGHPLAYLVYCHIHQVLQGTGATVLFDVKVDFPSSAPTAKPNTAPNPFDADVLVLHKGELWWIECKPSLKSGLDEHKEHRQGTLQAQIAGGRFGRAALVAYITSKDSKNLQSLRQAKEEFDPHGRYTLWTLTAPPPEFADPQLEVYLFPDRLSEVLRNWGWLR